MGAIILFFAMSKLSQILIVAHCPNPAIILVLLQIRVSAFYQMPTGNPKRLYWIFGVLDVFSVIAFILLVVLKHGKLLLYIHKPRGKLNVVSTRLD